MSIQGRQARWLATLLFAGAMCAARWVCATSYELFEQGAKSVGTAGANLIDPGDASVLATNPAGIAGRERSSFVGSLSLVRPSTHFSGTGRTFLPPPAGLPINGSDGGDPGSLVPVPSFFYATPVGRDTGVGIALFVPYGLSTSYDTDWVGRYHALNTELKTVNLSAYVATAPNAILSIGAGAGVVYAAGKLSSAIDFSSACLAQGAAFPPLAALCSGAGYTVPGNLAKDGQASFSGHAWAPAFSASAVLRLAEATKVSLGYRSYAKLDFEGTARFVKPADLPAPLAAAPQLRDGDASVVVHLPENVLISAVHGLDESTRLYFSAVWARWNRVQELRLRLTNGAPDVVLPLYWKNTWRAAAGLERAIGQWTVRAGVAYDQSPLRDEFREPRLPMTDRWIAGFGASYALKKDWSIDVGYLHMFFKTPTVNRSTLEAGTIQGEYHGTKIDMLTVQLGIKF